jgi:hypothetical protein
MEQYMDKSEHCLLKQDLVNHIYSLPRNEEDSEDDLPDTDVEVEQQ